MGPIALFDKSFLQTLSTDESVWFDYYFYPVVTPLFFIENLADLEKAPREGKTAEEEVAIIARKTPEMSGAPCYYHQEMCFQDLLGRHVPLTGRIPIAGVRQVTRNGKVGAVAEIPPEAKAFSRWQRGKFFDVERFHARAWRAQLARIDLSVIERAMRSNGVNTKTCKTLESALHVADSVLLGLTKSPGRFESMLELLEIPHDARRAIKDRWKSSHHPRLNSFAPYAAHVLRVEIFFQVAMGAKLIASTRASHKVDMAYLFYLPFCSIFVSNDKLHRLCAPLFLRQDQEFVWGQGLKADIAELNKYFVALPPDVKAQAIYRFADPLPTESQGLLRNLLQRYTPNLLKQRSFPDPSLANKDRNAKLVQHVKEWESAQAVPQGFERNDQELESFVLKRQVSRRRGSWVQIGPEVE